MAAAGLGAELSCFLCGNIYTEPVSLPCGHNFCRFCITESLNAQDESQFYTCPQCGKRFTTRPSLQRNTELCGHMERLQATREKSQVLCTYCVNPSAPAIKTCLQCEASLCSTHLAAHRTKDHELVNPTDWQKTRCSEHNMPLKYYCHQDSEGFCMDCYVLGKHRGHQVECLNEASEKKKEKLKELFHKLDSKRKEKERHIETFHKSRRREVEKASDMAKRVASLFRHLKEQLESEISMQKTEVSRYYSNLILELGKKAKEQSKTIINIETILHMTDPLSVLQSGLDEATIHQQEEEESKEAPVIKDLDADQILSNIYRRFSAILADVNDKLKKKGLSDESLHDLRKQEVDTVPGSKRRFVAGSPHGGLHRMKKKRESERHQSEETSLAPDSASVERVTSADTEVYRLRLTSPGRHTCSETGIQFEVTGPVVLECGLESWNTYMTDTQRKEYEIIGPLFHIMTQEGQNNVSAVYLPHYLSPECYTENKSYIKCVYFKDSKMTLKSPTRIEPSYVVLENPTFSYLGAVVEKLLTLIARPFTFNGVVLLYCKVDTTYCFRLYAMIDNVPRLKRAIDEAIGTELCCIGKPPQTNSVYVMKDYTVQGPHGAVIEPQVVRFRFTCPSQLYPYTEITLKDINEEIQLNIADQSTDRIIWSCSLKKEHLDQFRRITTGSAASGRSEQSPISEEKRFVQKNYESLCQRLGLLSPILLSLREKGVINVPEEEEITGHRTSLECNRTLLNMIIRKGAEKKFYQTLKANDPSLVEDLEPSLPDMEI